MDDATRLATGRVVNLTEYRAARAARALPLFDAPPEGQPVPRLAAASRPLDARAIAHRELMLRHLGSR